MLRCSCATTRTTIRTHGVPMFLRENDAIDSAVRRNYDYVPELGNRKVLPKGSFAAKMTSGPCAGFVRVLR